MNVGIAFILLLINVVSTRSQGLEDIIGIGRSIAGFIGSGINDFNAIQTILKEEREKVDSISGDSFSTDDLFGGLSDVWDRKSKNTWYKPRQADQIVTTEAIESKDMLALKVNKENVLGETKQTASENSSIETDSKINHWLRIKVIANNMKSIFQQTYGEDSEDKIEVLRMLDKLMDIGDKINMVKNIGNSFDHDLLEFLKEKWVDVEQEVLSSTPILKSMLSVDGKVLFLAIAKGLVRQFGSVFHKEALAHLNEQDFVIETMRRSGFTDAEIYDVFELLDLPTDLLVSTSKTLKEGGVGRSGGYGGGHGGGYGYEMMKKDPLILLAGIAFAAFAAYIIYRLLSSTPAVARRKRDFPDVSLSLTLSDMPEVMSNLHNWLEKTEQLYSDPVEEDNSSFEEGVINSVNEIWQSYEADPISRTCVRRNLCSQLQRCSLKGSCYGTNIKQLILLTLAELMGEKGAGKLADIQYTKMLKGQQDCELDFPLCDKIPKSRRSGETLKMELS